MKKTKDTIIKLFVVLLTVILLVGCGNEEITVKEEGNEENINIDDISQTKADIIVNNGEAFVQYNDDIYFWKISKNSREESALFGNLASVSNEQNVLVKLDKSGNEKQIVVGKGYGELYINNEKIFFHEPLTEYSGMINNTINSVNMEGKDKKEYGSGNIKGVLQDYIIYQDISNNICKLNTIDGNSEIIKQSANVIKIIDNTIYYEFVNEYSKLSIGSIENDKDNGVIATITSNDFEYYKESGEEPTLEIVDFWKENDKINFYVGYRMGTAHILQEEIIVKMNKDGSNITKNLLGIIGDTIEIEESEQVSKGIYEKTIKSGNNYVTDYMYVDSNTMARSKFMSKDELITKLGFKTGDEYYTNIYESSVIGDEVYCIIDNLVHDAPNDLGWRYAYKRLKTVYFKYNVKNKELTEIYSF